MSRRTQEGVRLARHGHVVTSHLCTRGVRNYKSVKTQKVANASFFILRGDVHLGAALGVWRSQT